jgi:processive 1,2-diacylglycerol beta-glucosyltransferase
MVNHAPALWGALYDASDEVKAERKRDRFLHFFDKLQFADFRQYLREFGPDILVSTHFLTCQVLAPYRKKGRDTYPLAVVVTDFDVHAFWVQPLADRFFVASDEVKFILGARGIPEEKIEVSGIPISQQFLAPWDKAAIRKDLGIADELPAVLVMSGGAGVGSMREAVEAALSGPPVSVLAVTGKNAALKAELESIPVPAASRLVVFGFVTDIARLMAAADLAITKSGGLTTSECLAMGLPMLVRDPIPGQEERNADYVVEAGAGVRVNGPHSLKFKLQRLLSSPARLAAMKAAARTASRPRSANQIVASLTAWKNG